MKYKLTIETDDVDELVNLITGSNVTVSGSVEQMTPPVSVAQPDQTEQPETEEPATPPAPAEQVAPSTDSAGMPWDERIHTSTKTQNADGTWRKRRGVDPDELAKVEAELKGSAPTEQATTDTQAEQATTDAPAEQATTDAPAPAAPAMPTGDTSETGDTPDAPPMPATTEEPAKPAELPKTFAGFMELVKSGLQAGTINPEYLQDLVAEINKAYEPHDVKIATITDLAQHEFMIEWVAQVMQNDGKVTL